MVKDKDVAEGRKKLLEEGAQELKCPVCGSSQTRFRTKDSAIVCRDGHTVFIDGTVLLSNGVRTTMDELRKEGIVKYRGEK